MQHDNTRPGATLLRFAPRLALALVCALAPAAVRAQEAPASNLRVFLDCQGFVPGCDFDFLRTRLPWVGWVRNRQDAGVHLLITTQQTGAGGRSYDISLIGLAGFAGRTDTLRFASPPASTDDDRRRLLARYLALGLVPFAARTGLAGDLDVAFDGDTTAAGPTAPAHDPWHRWVFRLRAGTSLEGESLQNSSSLDGSIDINRVTSDWKLELSLDGNYDENRYTLDDGSTTTAIQRRYSFDGLGARSLNHHWSAGLVGSLSSSTYSNLKLAGRVAPGLEYDIFPYSESTRRQLTVLYTLGPAYRDYVKETIHGKMQDRLVDQTLDVSLSLRQPWGSVYSSVQGRHILHWRPNLQDPAAAAQARSTKYRLSWFGNVDVNLLRGLALSLRGRASRVHDQITLPAEGASEEEILLRLRELQTDYTYRFSVGLSYTFGSIFNDIVNPRFDSY